MGVLFGLLEAVFTYAVEDGTMTVDAAVENSRFQCLVLIDGVIAEIQNLAAAGAYKVVVRACVTVKVFFSVSGREFQDLSDRG